MSDELIKRYLNHGLKLYWASTEDHWEDWFIVASSSGHAARLHEEYEGYDVQDIKVEEVMAIPDHIPAEPGWPGRELLLALGASYLNDEPARVVKLNGKVYSEGLMESIIVEVTDNAFEDRGDGRPNRTTRSTKN